MWSPTFPHHLLHFSASGLLTNFYITKGVLKKTNFVFQSNSPIMTINAVMPFCTYDYSFLRKKKCLTNPKLLNGSVIINSNISYVIACINNNQVIQIMLRLKRQMKRCSSYNWKASYNNLTCKAGHFAFHGERVWAEKQFSHLHIISWVLMWAMFRWLFLVIFNCMFWIWFE